MTDETTYEFEWVGIFNEVLERLDRFQREEMTLAIVQYGRLYEEPAFSDPMLKTLFIALRGAIDESRH